MQRNVYTDRFFKTQKLSMVTQQDKSQHAGELVWKRKYGGILMDPGLICGKVAGSGKMYLCKLQNILV